MAGALGEYATEQKVREEILVVYKRMYRYRKWERPGIGRI